jgi:hypothetical protein
MTAKVWIVTEGEYSDYRIKRIFSTRKLAKAYAKSIRDGFRDRTDIEEWDVDSEWNADEVYWLVRFYEGGELFGVYRENDGAERPQFLNWFERVQSPYHGQLWEGRVQARDHDHAIKVAAEQLAMAKAQLAGMG